MTTRRKLDTGDALDYVIPLDSPMIIGWAYLLSSASLVYRHTDDDLIYLTIPSDGSWALGGPVADVSIVSNSSLENLAASFIVLISTSIALF